MLLQATKQAEENKEGRAEWFTLSQFILFFFAIIFTIVSSQPLRTGSVGGVEQWVNVLPDFFSEKQDFLFSYGPLFWLTGQTVVQYSQQSYWISAVFISLYSAIMWAVLLRLALKHKFVIVLSIIYFVILKSFSLAAIYFTFPVFLLVYLRSFKKDRWLDNNIFLIVLALFTGFLFYVRFFYGAVALLTFGSYLFTTRLLHKKITPVLVFTLASFFFYLVIGWLVFHNIESIKNYAVINSQLSFGNSIDMTYDINLKKKAWLIIALVFVVFNLSLIKERSPLLLTVNGLFILFLKLGFSRADHYIFYFIGPVALMALVCSTGIHRWGRLSSGFIVCMLLVLGSISIYPYSPSLTWFKVHEDFNQSPAQRSADAYPQFKLPGDMLAQIGDHSIDVYPYQNEYLLSNKLNYVHRPSFQNYMTLTPGLEKLNVDFYTGEQAPEYVLWHGNLACLNVDCAFYDDFDYKYILNEDPLTVMAIMANYHRVGQFIDVSNRPVILMKKNEVAKSFTPNSIGKITLHFGQWVDVPQVKSGVVKLKPAFNFTLKARLQNMFYRGGVVYVNYRMDSGDIKRYRLNVINSQSGIWVSPLLDLVPQRGQRVVQIMIETPSKHYFNNEIKAIWEHYAIEGIEIYEKKYSSFKDEKPKSISESTAACDASMDLLDVNEFKVGEVTRSLVHSAGWNVYSIASKIPSDRAWLTATDAVGNRKYLALNNVARPDVADHFASPQFTNAGYDIIADASDLKGQYTFSLAIASQGKLLQCSNISRSLTLH